MPRILLVNCSNELAEVLRTNADYQVTSVVRSKFLTPSMPSDMPDPRTFNIVIDDSSSADSEGHPNSASQETTVVPIQYTDALKDANALIYVPFGRHDLRDHGERYADIRRKGRPAYLRPDWRPVCSEADFFRNFLVEFGEHMEPVVMKPVAFDSPNKSLELVRDPLHIYVDEYGDPRIFSYFEPDESCRILVTPNIVAEQKVRACQFLVDNVFPFFVPEAYTDVLIPSTVAQLHEQWVSEQAQYRERFAGLEREISAEQDYYAPFKPLIRLLGFPLQGLVKQTFEDIWGLDVADLDEEADRAGERRRADLLLRQGGWRALVEVTGGGKRAARVETDLEPFLKHTSEYETNTEALDARVLIFNPHTSRPLPERRELPPFGDEFLEDARNSKVTVMSTFDLFRLIELARGGRMDTRRLRRLLSQPGLIELT